MLHINKQDSVLMWRAAPHNWGISPGISPRYSGKYQVNFSSFYRCQVRVFLRLGICRYPNYPNVCGICLYAVRNT